MAKLISVDLERRVLRMLQDYESGRLFPRPNLATRRRLPDTVKSPFRKIADFSLDEPLTTSSAGATATIEMEYGPGKAAPGSSIVVLNPMDQAFFGDTGARGLAWWTGEGEYYVILQLYQDCTPAEEE